MKNYCQFPILRLSLRCNVPVAYGELNSIVVYYFFYEKNGKCHSIEPFVGLKWLRFFLFHLMASFVVLFSKFDFFFIGQYSVRVVHRLDKFLLNRVQSQLRTQESIRRFLLTKNHKFSDGNYYGWIFTSAASAIFHKPKTTHTQQQQREK